MQKLSLFSFCALALCLAGCASSPGSGSGYGDARIIAQQRETIRELQSELAELRSIAVEGDVR
jgi:hypothetical protein